MMNFRLILCTCLLCFIVIFVNAQTKQLDVKPLISLDSLTDIEIDKLVYYSKPIELRYFSLTDTMYIPIWYKTFCANSNLYYFKNSLKDAVHYFSPEYRLTEDDIMRMYQKVESLGGIEEYYKNYPDHKYLYIYNEIWFYEKTRKEKYLIIQGFYSDSKIENLELSPEIKDINQQNEKIDSLANSVWTTFTFKEINDTIKWTKQANFDTNILKGKYTLNPHIKTFKNLVFRKNEYYLSNIQNSRRVFRTMKKNGKYFQSKEIKESIN